jgi:putative phage-type endonuclease
MDLTHLQRAQRSQGIGSSDIAAIAGLNPWRGPMDVWLSKIGRDTFTGNDRTEWGHTLEPGIAAFAAKALGLGEPTPVKETYRSREHGEVLATPDYILGADTILECKNVGLRVAHHWSDGPPDYVVAQTTWQSYVTGLHNAFAAASLAGDPPQTYRVEYDADFAEGLVDLGLRFWRDHVLTESAPALDHGEATATYLRGKYSQRLNVMKDADDEIAATLAEAKQLWLDIKRLTQELDLRKHRVMDFIGEAAGVQGDLGKTTWKVQRGRVSTSQVIANLASRLNLSQADLSALEDQFRGDPPRVFLWPSRLWGKEVSDE